MNRSDKGFIAIHPKHKSRWFKIEAEAKQFVASENAKGNFK